MSNRCPTCGRVQGKDRSSLENNYYWGVVVGILAEEKGNTPNEMHEILKWNNNSHMVIEYGGQRIEVPNSTKDLTTGEFEAYLSRCREWASGEGVFIPLPNEAPL